MRRIAILPAFAAALVLSGCAAGTLAPGAGDASSSSPSPSVATPSTEPSPSPSPTASPSASEEPAGGNRFDDVDLAAALVPVVPAPDPAQGWSGWQTADRELLVPAAVPSAFPVGSACATALEAYVALAPIEVVRGGYAYEGVLGSSVIVARMASADAAAGAVDALLAAAAACESEQGGTTAMRLRHESDQVPVPGSVSTVLVASDGAMELSPYVLRAHEELIVATVPSLYSEAYEDFGAGVIDSQVAAFEAAAQ